MRYSILISLLLVSAYHIHAQKNFSNFLNVFPEAQRVVDSFVHYHPSEDFQNYTDKKVKLKDIDQLLEIVESKRSKPPVFEIKDFRTLDPQQLRLFELLNERYGETQETADLYYSIILYWLLPHRLCHQIPNPVKEDDYHSYSRYVLNKEVLIDEMTYQFMVVSDIHEELPNFYSLVSAVIQYTQPKDVVYVSELFERPLPMNELAKRFYLNASTMKLALDAMATNKENKIEAPVAYYNERDYLAKSERIIEDFKIKYHEKDEDSWYAHLETFELESDLVKYYRKSYSKKFDIKSYNSLKGSEIAFLEDVQERYGNEEPTIDFYYKIIHNWLLPHELLKLTLQMNQVGLEKQAEELQRLTLSYMSENSLIQQFRDFNKLCRTIVLLTEQQRSEEQLQMWEDKPLDHTIEYSIYKHAKQMMGTIDEMSSPTSAQ